jgi:metal-responsive CopG/Arc/MetJ family transcriptional regulator
MANRIVLEASNRLKRSLGKSALDNKDTYISNYGLSNNRELVAEAVRDYMVNKENAKPISKQIVEIIKKYCKSTGLSNKGGN